MADQPPASANWLPGWGFEFISPDGNVNNATFIRTSAGQVQQVVKGPNGSISYVNVPATTPNTPTGPAPSTTADSSARALIMATLGTYGLASLADWAWGKWQAGETIDQIMLELRDTAEYKQRFPAMADLSARGRAISESEYIGYEQGAAAIMRAAGLPTGFFDTPDDFADFLRKDIALPELQERVRAYQTAAFQEPQEVRDALQDYYGLTPGDMVAFYIDPQKALPILQQQNAAAAAGGWANVTGFGAITREQAEQVGALGLDSAQVGQTFGKLAALDALYDPLQGTTETGIGSDTALRAGFFDDAEAQADLEERRNRRLATFQGGGGVVTNQSGAVGAGSAR